MSETITLPPMDFNDYYDAVRSIANCKRVGQDRYLHKSALPRALEQWVAMAVEVAAVDDSDFNVVKVSEVRPSLSLLSYPGLFDEAFPVLRNSWTVHLATRESARRHYPPISNAPVLHRKELLLPSNDPRRPALEALTQAAEALGLFTDTQIIGHRVQWEEELRARGVKVQGHNLLPRTPEDEEDFQIVRHRTALHRSQLSTPMQALWRHGYLEGRHSVFDYGCGRGDDLRALGERQINARGWDPYFFPEGILQVADVVNLGFVINVIENLNERREAIECAYSLASEVLVVAALIGGRTAYERHRLYRDGVLTSIGTFQKYFTQAELGEYLQDILKRDPIAVAPGVYFVFKCDDAEQNFLIHRRNSRMTLPRSVQPRPSRQPTAPRLHRRNQKQPTKWERHDQLLHRFWQRCLTLGRLPAEGEFSEELTLREELGFPKQVLRHLFKMYGEKDWLAVRTQRQADLEVYLALNLFEQRRSFSTLPVQQQRDIREFWRSYKAAQLHAQKLLFSTGDTRRIRELCQEANANGTGYLDSGSLWLHTSQVVELPSILRIYIGCAEVLYGEAEEADLVRLFYNFPRIVLMSYDDFEGQERPRLLEEVTIDLKLRHIRFQDYGDRGMERYLEEKERFFS